MSKFEDVFYMTQQLNLTISERDHEQELLVVQNPTRGVNNMIIDCEESILVIEQHLGALKKQSDVPGLKQLLQLNRQLVHGSFVLDSEGKNVLFRDTLALENLDLNELEGSINSLTIGLEEFGPQLVEIIE